MCEWFQNWPSWCWSTITTGTSFSLLRSRMALKLCMWLSSSFTCLVLIIMSNWNATPTRKTTNKSFNLHHTFLLISRKETSLRKDFTLYYITFQHVQTHFKNLAASVEKFLKCVRPFLVFRQLKQSKEWRSLVLPWNHNTDSKRSYYSFMF